MATKRRQNTLLTNVLPIDFFQTDALEIAPLLLGKKLVRELPSGERLHDIITEVEVYRGEEDLACHASKGRTRRTEVMYKSGGHIYVYLIYGMYDMFNIVTGSDGYPQAILIRGTKNINGPGKLTRYFFIDRSLNGKLLVPSTKLWIEETNLSLDYETTPRIGVEYAKEWKLKPWRYVAKNYR